MKDQGQAKSREGNVGQPVWPRIPSAFVRAMLAGHSALGLAFAALIYVVCFSGSVAVFTQEFERWEMPSAPAGLNPSPSTVQADGARLEAAMDEVMALYPWAHELLFQLPASGGAGAFIYVEPDHDDKAQDTVTVRLDRNGQLAGAHHTPWSRFQAKVHTVLHLPEAWGGFVVGLTGVALLSSLISGVLSHPRVFRDAFTLRIGGNKRLQEADLHNRLSIWALPFHLVVSLTGAFLGLVVVIVGVLAMAAFGGDSQKAFALFAAPVPVDNPAKAPLPRITPALVDAYERLPGSRPVLIRINHPGEAGAAVSLTQGTKGKLSIGESLTYDRNGAYIGSSGFETGTIGQKIVSTLFYLHFGWFGGLPVKILYGSLGLALTVVTSSGVAIWLARRRDKGRPAPAWERLWVALVWSQPLAYAVTACLSVLNPHTPFLMPVWLTVTALCGVGSQLVRGQGPVTRISRILRAACGLGLYAVVAAHGLRHGLAAQLGALSGQSGDLMPLYVNLSLVMMGSLLLASALWRRA
ncbi:MAG: PepSY-associated TM helix domain-containing protein [Asticcacaulis sp.]